jgi:hypothetical protein
MGGITMANYCNYEIHARGPKKAALMLFTMIPCCDSKEITHEEGTDDKYIVHMIGNCKWSLDHYCKENPDVKINLDEYSEDDVRDEECGLDYWYLPMSQKSELLGLEILAHSWSEESEYDQMEEYNNGRLVSCDYAPLAPDWCEYEDEFDSYQDFCEAFNINPNQNPPMWNTSEYPYYTDFCDAFGLDPEIVLEEDWDEDEDNIYYYMSAEKMVNNYFEFAF